VIQLQQFLIGQNLLSNDSVTGYFGAHTQAAVQAFQKSQAIVSSGNPATTGYGAVGPKTRAAFASDCGAPPQTISQVQLFTAALTYGTSPLTFTFYSDTSYCNILDCDAKKDYYFVDFGDGSHSSCEYFRSLQCDASRRQLWHTDCNTYVCISRYLHRAARALYEYLSCVLLTNNCYGYNQDERERDLILRHYNHSECSTSNHCNCAVNIDYVSWLYLADN